MHYHKVFFCKLEETQRFHGSSSSTSQTISQEMRSGPYFMKSRGNILISRQPKNSTYSPGTLADGNLRMAGPSPPPFGDQISRNVRNNHISSESSLNFRQPLGDLSSHLPFQNCCMQIRHFRRIHTFQESPVNISIEILPTISPFLSKSPLFKGPL